MAEEYVVVVWPTLETESDDVPDAYGPLTLSAALQARDSVLRGTPDVGMEVAKLHETAVLFSRYPLP
jgi:hypothetical protein